MPSGVGVIGAGPGASALHLATLARLSDRFTVVHVSDGGGGRAEELAARLGATASTGTDELLADPRVEVVAICSPPDAHASQILAAVAAGKHAILCEKPIATSPDDAARVIDACRNAGIALVVGTNHLFDPAWGRAQHHLTAGGAPVRAISITVALPPNERYHDAVSELPPAAAPARGAPDWGDPSVAAAVLRQLTLGLAIHDLPLVRDLARRLDRVVFARPVSPIGYVIGFLAEDIAVRLTAVMVPGGADALWRIGIVTSRDLIDIEFPPAFVHVGSAAVRVRTPDGRRTSFPLTADDGYVAEWRALASILDGDAVVEYDEILADAGFAFDLADAVEAAVRAGAIA
ncbi:Gfo/Idh/MocA family protein [Microbacterium abyssi]|uniref:Gfo/Idh/MocA family protein n=1 Tax=Microbacterium abyssi TaxID=2782166 RepID=UPI0018887A89|nr:Gfo/Idh/MocA family oxidoreductase [Microbacterium sp. A18JL241]